MNIAGEAKVCSPVRSTFEALVVRFVVGRGCGEELGPFCSPVLAADTASSVHLIDLLSILLKCSGFTRIPKAVVNQISRRPQNSDRDLFCCKFGFGKCFGASFQSNY